MSRRCKDWTATLREYVEDTESPRDFWLWSGLFTIGAALQRRVWIPFGMSEIFPNLFIMLVAPPGWSRKGLPPGFSKEILEEIGIPVGIDSPTKRHLTKRLHTLSETEQFTYKGRLQPQAPLALISKELSSFLAVDAKSMVECLTDIYDSHKKWDYGTAGKGEDFIRNVCVSCFFATTPGWIADNLPPGSVGGGFTSRFIIVSGLGRYKEVPWPPPPDKRVFKMLLDDLENIRYLTGEFKISPEARKIYEEWYPTIKPWADQIGDIRLYNNFSRVHVQAIKTAMCLHVARSDELMIEGRDMQLAIELMRRVYATASDAFSGHGKSPLAVSMDRIIKACKDFKSIRFSKLLALMYRDATRSMIHECVENLEMMKMVKVERCKETGETFISWIGRR